MSSVGAAVVNGRSRLDLRYVAVLVGLLIQLSVFVWQARGWTAQVEVLNGQVKVLGETTGKIELSVSGLTREMSELRVDQEARLRVLEDRVKVGSPRENAFRPGGTP